MLDHSHCVALFRATRVPRYDEEGDAFLAENTSKQAALWDAVRHALYDLPQPALVVEVRYTSDVQTQRITLEVLLWCLSEEPGGTHQAVVNLLENMLPEDYEWQRTEYRDIAANYLPGGDGQEWYISRLIRRLDWVDLPGGSVFDAESVSGQTRSDIDQELADYIGRRRLPGSATSGTDIEHSPHCLAVPAPILGAERNLRRVLGQTLRLGPTVISLTMAPLDATLLNLFRPLVSHWRSLLLASNRAAWGGPAAADPRPVLSADGGLARFLMPQPHLCHVAMRVAAATHPAAVAIAQHVASCHGGIKSFEIRSYRRNKQLGVISDPWVEIPTADWTASDWSDACGDVDRLLEQQWIDGSDISDSHRRLLAWLPFVYTGEEAGGILQLPRAISDGMPGMETRPLPPFIGSVERPCLVVNPQTQTLAPPPAGEVRIGISRPGGGIGSEIGCGASDGDDISEMVEKYRAAHWHTIDVTNLTKHAFIVGSTGSGKTMSTLFLVRELARLGKPFMVIEPVKTEYSDALKPFDASFSGNNGEKGIKRLRFEGNREGKRGDDFLAFDPMRIPLGVSVARHASYLKACFEASFPLDPVPALLLEAGIQSYYTSPPWVAGPVNGQKIFTRGCGLQLFTLGHPDLARVDTATNTGNRLITPSLRAFTEFFLDYFLPKSLGQAAAPGGSQNEWIENWKQMFKRRLDNLWLGLVGEAARCAEELYFADSSTYECLLPYLQRPTIIELDGIPDADQKALVMAFLLTYLFERRQADDFMRRNPHLLSEIQAAETAVTEGVGLKHVLIIEEAHRILAPVGNNRGGDTVGLSSRAKAVSLFVDMLAEIRALGQGLVIVEQIPTKIIPEAVKNTNLKIMLRLTSKEDRDYLGEAMNFTEQQKRFVTSLRARGGHGIDMVVFEEGVDQPLMLSLPLPPKRGAAPWLYNEFFRETS